MIGLKEITYTDFNLCECNCGEYVLLGKRFIFGHQNNLRKQKVQISFLNQAKIIFPQYDFSQFKYIDSKTKSIVICSDHGQFKAPANNILNGHGCPECKKTKAIQLAKNRFFKEIPKEFSEYNFSQFKYINSKIKGEVICKIHGEFLMTPNSLRAGKGCQLCGIEKSTGWNPIAKYQKLPIGQDFGIFYKLLFTHKLSKIKFIKIGITNKILEHRYINKEYKDFDYEVINIWHGTNLKCAIKEKEYKKKNRSKRFCISNNIEFPGRTECYEYDKDQQLNINGLRFIRESFIIKQNGICPICKKNLIKPVLDHHHTKRIKGTGKCRAVLCATCNIFLGKIENNCIRYRINQKILPNVLRSIANLLEKKQSKYIHPNERIFKKLGKREYNRICKYYFQMYPRRKKLPEYPKSGKMTRQFEELLERTNEMLREKENK